jgi:hypothetical protein
MMMPSHEGTPTSTADIAALAAPYSASPPLGRPPRHVLLVHHLSITPNLSRALEKKKSQVPYADAGAKMCGSLVTRTMVVPMSTCRTMLTTMKRCWARSNLSELIALSRSYTIRY